MAKVNNKTKGFGSIPRDVVYDNELSDRARFVYVYMACKSENWEFYQDRVANELGYGKDTLRKYLDELIVRGWITENEQQNDGKFGCLEYVIEVKRKVGNLPIRKKADSEKTRNGKIPNQRNIDNISSKQSLSDNKEIENKKRLSNDNQKVEYSEDFENFWKLYGYSKGKQRAYGKWNKLSDTDKQKAIDAIPAYLEDCARCKRDQQHAATYLFNHTFEDDFSAKPKRALYDPIDGEDEQKTRFKRWMRANYPEIETTALPLSYEDYMELVKGDHIEDVTNALTNIHNEIYKYRRSDIAQVIKAMLPKEDE